MQSALISVFYKDGLEPIAKKLKELGITICPTPAAMGDTVAAVLARM